MAGVYSVGARTPRRTWSRSIDWNKALKLPLSETVVALALDELEALDVEVADLAEVEELLVEVAPEGHAPAIDVVRQVIDDLQAVAHRMSVDTFDELEVDVVDRPAFFEAVDQVQGRAPDAFDRGQPQLHRTGRHLQRLRTAFERELVRLARVLHPEREATRRGPMLRGEVARSTSGLAIDHEVDAALPVQHHVLRTVLRDHREAELLEHRFQRIGGGRRELDELEAHQSHGVLEQVSHFVLRA